MRIRDIDPERVGDLMRSAAFTVQEMAAAALRVADVIREFGEEVESFLQQSEKGDTLTLVSTDQEGGQL
jgi:hypothetical protein